MNDIDKLIAIAERENGVKESPAGSNRVKYNTWYYGKEVRGSAYPWCMAFVQWCFDRAGIALPLKTASCGSLASAYAKEGRIVKKDFKRGDIAFMSFNGSSTIAHVGIVKEARKETLVTIEGNTSLTSQDNGGAVMIRERPLRYIVSAARPDYKIEEEDEDMTQDKFNEMMNAWLDDLRAKEESEWSVKEGAWEKATQRGTVNGSAPQAFITRQEIIAVLDRLGLI